MGGQSIPAWDFFLAPYAKKSFVEHFVESYMDDFYSKIEEQDFSSHEDDLIEAKKDIENQYGEIQLSNEKLKEKMPLIFNIAKRKLIKETKQAHESFVANMNTMHSRGGGQIVFSSVNTGTDFSPEGRIINKALLEALYRGLGNGETSIFPIVIWKVKEDVNWNDDDYSLALANNNDAINGKIDFKAPNFDLTAYAMHVAAKRLFPTFMFLDATFNKHENWNINDPERYKWEGATMGCRTRVFENVLGDKTALSRGNISFSTINLVRLAIESKIEEPEDKEKRLSLFYDKLDEKTDLIKNQLLERLEFQSNAKAKQFPFFLGQGIWTGGESLAPEDTVGDIIKQGTLGIGFIGLSETLILLNEKHHGESEESQELGLDIVRYLRSKIDCYKNKYKLNFSLLSTPAESLSGKFTKKDKKEFGIIPGVTDKEYYTNSSHVNVAYKISAYEKIKIEAPYHELSTGGHILYVEMDSDAEKNPTAFMSIVKTMKDNNVGYGAINVPSCRCLQCGYDRPFEDKCPKCGERDNISIIKRITGYLVGNVNRWNSAKQAEERDRVKHGAASKE